MARAGMSAGAATVDPQTGAVLAVDNLSVEIGTSRLLRDITFSLAPGEVVALVGESGSGKTLTGLSILGLTPRAAHATGSVRLLDSELLSAPTAELRRVRGREISMIFQEPRASLHPSLTIGRQIVDVIRAHERVSRQVAAERVLELFEDVGLPDPAGAFTSYARELSGGMCQRAMIAMALACRPRVLIADEPTTALDATIQAQILALLRELTARRGISILLITHDLGVVADVCDRVITMYCGEIVHADSTLHLLEQPSHPYPWALIKSSRSATDDEDWAGLAGRPANPATPPSGCRFHPRCPFVEERCQQDHPPLTPRPDGSATRCLRHEELDLEHSWS